MGIKLERLRNAPYEVNYNYGVRPERYVWNPSKGKLSTVVEVSDDCYMYLLQNSSCFRDGELRIIESEFASAEKDVIDIEEYKANSHSREEVENLLKGNVNKLKAELDKIENPSEITYFVDVAKEIKIDKASVQKALADKIGTPVDVLFDDEE